MSNSNEPPETGDWQTSDGANCPTKFGRYRVIKKLGEGSFGQVYLASDDELDRLVAIKVSRVIQNPFGSNAETFLTEARTLASLDHPNVVPVYDLGSTNDGHCFIVSKYIEGRDLAAQIKENQLSHQTTAELIETVANTLHYAHVSGLIHRDVKPSNILLDTAGVPFVADFGLAINEDQQRNLAGHVGGTLPYMAPEQARGETHRLDGRVDIWALGVVLYEMLTGRRPFRGSTTSELVDEILHREAKPPRQIDESIPIELERIALNCVSKRIVERYSASSDLAYDLRCWLESPRHATKVSNEEPSSAKVALVEYLYVDRTRLSSYLEQFSPSSVAKDISLHEKAKAFLEYVKSNDQVVCHRPDQVDVESSDKRFWMETMVSRRVHMPRTYDTPDLNIWVSVQPEDSVSGYQGTLLLIEDCRDDLESIARTESGASCLSIIFGALANRQAVRNAPRDTVDPYSIDRSDPLSFLHAHGARFGPERRITAVYRFRASGIDDIIQCTIGYPIIIQEY